MVLRRPLKQCRIVGPAWRSRNSTPASNLVLPPGLLLLESGCPRFDQSTLDAASDLRWEYGSGVQRPRDRLFPSLEHLIQLPASL